MRSDGEMNGLVNRFNKMFLGHVIPADGSVVY